MYFSHMIHFCSFAISYKLCITILLKFLICLCVFHAIAISDVSHLSCVSNDFGYEYVFSRFVEAVGKEGDVLFGLSTSGNSKNILNAIEAAKAKGMKVIAMTGKDGGKMAGLADVEIRVPHGTVQTLWTSLYLCCQHLSW